MGRRLGSTSLRAHLSRRLTVVMIISMAFAASCSVADAPRWERSDDGIVAAANDETLEQRGDTAIVEAGPIVDVITFRATVGFAETITVDADRVGRIERRLIRVGDSMRAGDTIFELSAARDPADDLRIEILERQRELAELEERLDELDDFDAQLAAERAKSLPGGAGTIDADTDGVLNRYLADVFSTVRAGMPLYELGVGTALVATFSAPAGSIPGEVAVGATVMVRKPGPLAQPIPVSVVTMTETREDNAVEIAVSLPADVDATIGEELDIDIEATSEAGGLRVPTDAVRNGPDGPFVVVVDDDSLSWAAVRVEIGGVSDDFTQLLGDTVAAGSEVIVP